MFLVSLELEIYFDRPKYLVNTDGKILTPIRIYLTRTQKALPLTLRSLSIDEIRREHPALDTFIKHNEIDLEAKPGEVCMLKT